MKYLVKIPRLISFFILLLSLMASTCEPDIPEPPVTDGSSGGSGSGSAVCSGSYRSPVSDVQLDSFCAAAYAYRCLDGLALSSQQVQSVCSIYNSIREPGTPDCPYCKQSLTLINITMNHLTRSYLVLLLLLISSAVLAQDLIIKKDGTEISAKVVEVEDLKVRYRRFDQGTTGPVYSITKAEIFMIRYEDGTKDVFGATQPSTTTPAQTSPPVSPVDQPLQTTPTQTNTTSALTTASQNTYSSASSNTTSSRFYISYAPGTYAGLGVSMGGLTNKGALYFTGRFSGNSFGEVSIYEMNDADGIDDDFWIWEYTGNYQYRRGSFLLGYMANMGGDLDGTSIHGYFGIGYGYANYMYEYEQIGDSGTSYGYEWIKYTDVSKSSVEAEFGMLVDLNGFNLSIGYSTLAFSEGMLTFGVGLSFKR